MDQADDKKEIAEMDIKRFYQDRRVGDREIRKSVPGEIKTVIVCLRTENNREADAEIVGNYLTIY